jgi:hypothetical protein
MLNRHQHALCEVARGAARAETRHPAPFDAAFALNQVLGRAVRCAVFGVAV